MKIDLRKLNLGKVSSPPDGNMFKSVKLDSKFLLPRAFGIKAKESFYHELAVLLQAGVVLKSALDLLVEGERGRKRLIIEEIRNQIVEGVSFSHALKQEAAFTAYDYVSIQIGEETGDLTTIMTNLSDYYKKILRQRRLINSALAYPVIVVIIACIAIWFMLNFIVPMFSDIFSRSGGTLPPLTKSIISVSSFFKSYGGTVFILAFGFSISIYTQRNKKWFRSQSTQLVLKIPLLGEMIRKSQLARFCHSMALLSTAKVPLVNALSLSRKMTSFFPLKNALDEVEQMVITGATLQYSLSQHPIFDKKMISLLKVGEEVNELATFFQKIAEQYQEEVDHQSKMLSSLLEPFIIVFLGFFVGIILIAMYLPLFQLGSGFE